MSDSPARQTGSPDPASHAVNAYDVIATESELDELDERHDDGMDFFNDDEAEPEFRGTAPVLQVSSKMVATREPLTTYFLFHRCR